MVGVSPYRRRSRLVQLTDTQSNPTPRTFRFKIRPFGHVFPTADDSCGLALLL